MDTECTLTRVAILIVAYNGTRYLEDCLSSVLAANVDGIQLNVFVLDNASSDGTRDYVREHFSPVHLIESRENLGFAEGNNRLFREALSICPECEFVYLLNQDTIVDHHFLTESVAYLQRNDDVDVVQSLLLLYPETLLINTAGNRIHFLGFGLPTYYRAPVGEQPENGVIDYPSGAAVLIRVSSIRDGAVFDASLFMYLEDAQLGWTQHLIDRPPHRCVQSLVYHKYEFNSTMGSYAYLERNRWWLLLTHYRLPTLVLLMPAIVAMELGQIVFCIQNGLLRAKAKAVVQFFSPTFFSQTLAARRRIQRERLVSDRQIVRRWSGTLDSPHLQGALIRLVANPLFSLYHRGLCFLVWW